MTLIWRPRRQWVCLTQQDGIASDITITKEGVEFTWSVVVNRIGSPMKYGDSSTLPARSLIQAKSQALKASNRIVEQLTLVREAA